MVWILPKLSNYQQVAPSVRTGGSRHTGLAAPPHRNIQREKGGDRADGWSGRAKPHSMAEGRLHCQLQWAAQRKFNILNAGPVLLDWGGEGEMAQNWREFCKNDRKGAGLAAGFRKRYKECRLQNSFAKSH